MARGAVRSFTRVAGGLLDILRSTAGVLAATMTRTRLAATTASAALCAALLFGPWVLNSVAGYSASPLVEFSLFVEDRTDLARYLGSLIVASIVAFFQLDIATGAFRRWRQRDR